jgi:hypothetical protein
VLFDENTVGRCVFGQELLPFNMGKQDVTRKMRDTEVLSWLNCG